MFIYSELTHTVFYIPADASEGNYLSLCVFILPGFEED